MGRRSAPQPLALSLAEGNSSSATAAAAATTAAKDTAATTTTAAATTATATATAATTAAATTLGPSEPTAPATADRPSPRSFNTSDNTLQVLSPSLSNKSQSPRSPFSKFNPTRRPQTAHQGESRPPAAEAFQASLPLRSADDAQITRQHTDYSNFSNHSNQSARNYPTTPFFTKQFATSPSLPQIFGPTPEKHSRSGSRFFNKFGKGSKSSNQPHQVQPASNSEASPAGADIPIMAERVPSKTSKHSDRSSPDIVLQKPAPALISKSELSLPAATEHDAAASKRSKPKPFALLGRNRSLKESDHQIPEQDVTTQTSDPERLAPIEDQQPLKTAPINPEAHDRSFRNMMNSSTRNHSADRAYREVPSNKENRNIKENRSQPPSIRDIGPSTFFSGLKNLHNRATENLTSKGFFGKSGRSASTTEREPVVDDEHYVLKVINLPLIEQTRKTRISKRLEESRDKTEFWMPAFPWRAIDYLNFNGTEVEGLYRVPGSGPQIKKWQRKFDEELDVDLFAQHDLYDINIIGSMLKAWLRELPDELFPKEAQERISRHCAGAEKVPQMLIDELSNLPPFKYYLLFAVTCHLSLLLAHSERNKMDFRNLCICFQPCMKIDAFCFKFLVCDWRLCWQGCRNEARYIEEEYKLFQQPLPRGLAGDRHSPKDIESESQDDRAISSSDGSKGSSHTTDPHHDPRQEALLPSQPNGNLTVGYAHPANPSVDRQANSEHGQGLRPLSPIKPLSPMNF
ncbi:hypothetical protein F4808DRAFT_337442 [Astrocystis sublimbata]|nr:hypothetical protein F4808DRAFT_337442 [Astrocystis sublimbata]